MSRSFRSAAILGLLLSCGQMLFGEIRVTSEEALKAVIKKPQPDYPPIAKQLKVTGRVEVDVTIDAEGNVESVKILTGNAMLTAAVVSAVKKWKFEPFKKDGAAAKAITMLEFGFKI